MSEEEIFDLDFDLQSIDDDPVISQKIIEQEQITPPHEESISIQDELSSVDESVPSENIIHNEPISPLKNPFQQKENPFQQKENPFLQKNPFRTQTQVRQAAQNILGSNIFGRPKNPFTVTNPFSVQKANTNPTQQPLVNSHPTQSLVGCSLSPTQPPLINSHPTQQPLVGSSLSPTQEDLDSAIQRRVETELAKIKRKKKKKSLPDAIKNLIPEGHTVIETAAGTFVIPIYDEMSTEEQRKHRKKFKTLYKSFNISWKGKHTIDMFTDDDTLTDIDIKYQHSIRYVKQQNSFNLPKLIMIVCWGGIEIIARKMGIKADGYFVSQLQMCDVYESKMIQMGSIGGVGEDWPVWLQLVIVSAVNLILIVILNKWCKGLDTNNKTCIMRGVSQFISGNRTSLDVNEDGSFKPSSDPISSAIGMNLGGLNLTNLIGSFMGNMFGGGGDDDDEEDEEAEKPKKKRSRRKKKTGNGRKREAVPEVTVDADGIPEEI